MLIIDGQGYDVEGVETANWIDDEPRLALSSEDCRPRNTNWVRSIILHNTKNRPTSYRFGEGKDYRADLRVAQFWSGSKTAAGAHMTIDADGSVGQHCDLLTVAAYHAGMWNDVSIGIEIFQLKDGTIWEVQLDVMRMLVNFLTEFFRIPRQMPTLGDRRVIHRAKKGGKSLVGVFGHCHGHAGKKNDPGAHAFEWLRDDYEQFDFNAMTDLKVWKIRQKKMGMPPEQCDGIPGPKTMKWMEEHNG